MAAPKKINLTRLRDKKSIPFEIGHALALLRRNSKDWKITDGQKYEFKGNEIIGRKSNKADSEAES